MKRLLLALLVTVPLFASNANNEITPDNVLALMNAYRAQEGLAPLRLDPRITRAAEDRMRDMEQAEYWSHDSPSGVSPFVWLTARDYYFEAAGENLARGFDTARFLVESWMESHGHRENIMSTEYEDCGIAIIEGATTGRATGKSIVVLFGRIRRPESTDLLRAPSAASRQ
jgi:uncharacterized protein YkwD